MDIVLIAIRFVHLTTAMLLFGASLFPFYTGVKPNEPRLFRIVIAGLALVSGLAWVAAEAVSMSGEASAWASCAIIAKVLQHTEFGHIWRWRVGLLAALAGLALLSRVPRLLFCIIAGISVVTLAGVGHGDMGIGNEIWLHLGNQAIHILSASVWLGGLAALLLLIRQKPAIAIVRQALCRFSLVGLVTVLLIVATGLVNAWFLVGSVDALLHTDYGKVLMVKISFFLAMVALALLNRLILMPMLASHTVSEKPQRLLFRSIAVEQCFAILAVAAVSILGMMTPGMSMPGMVM